MSITRVFDIIDGFKTSPKKEDIVCRKENKQWKKYSTDDFITHCNLVSYGLMALGLKENDKIAILSENRPEWNFMDFGCQQAGIVTVPIFPTISQHELQFILNHSEAKAVFISGRSHYAKLASLEAELPNIRFVFSFDEIEEVKSFRELLELGQQQPQEAAVEQIKASITPDRLLTILYTSGTTGVPKGVMLSHHNLVSNILACQDFAPFASWWRALSFLPLNHVYERMVNNLYLYKHISIYYAEGIETIGDNLKEIQPQIFVSVPRLIERVHDRIISTGEKLTGAKKKIFDWAIHLTERYEVNHKNGMWYDLQRRIADRLVYKKWREALGGKMVCIVSGGAALNPRLERFFLCGNITLLQGYGLTETSPVLSVNYFGKDEIRIGTVGQVIPGMQVKIAEEDGEILAKGPCIMMGYYKNEEATQEVIDANGWFHTGDVGTIIEGRFLKITDRKKEIFKTNAGKYIAPLAIENRLKESRYVDQCMVIGESQKFASALIVPNFQNFRDYCRDHNIEWQGNAIMSQHEELKRLIQTHIKKINSELAPYEQLKRSEILPNEWSVEGGEITPKLSLRRKVIKEKYKEFVDRIYELD